MKAISPTDYVILTPVNFIVHTSCSSENPYGERDKGKFYEVAARNFHLFQGFVKEFNKMGYYERN